MVEPDEVKRGVAAVISQGGDQAVVAGVVPAAAEGGGDLGVDDPQGERPAAGEPGAVWQAPDGREPAAVLAPDEQVGAGGGDLAEQAGDGEVTVGQQQHSRP